MRQSFLPSPPAPSSKPHVKQPELDWIRCKGTTWRRLQADLSATSTYGGWWGPCRPSEGVFFPCRYRGATPKPSSSDPTRVTLSSPPPTLLQQRLEKLPEVDQQTANTIWSLFSSASGSARILTLRGLLTICCPSQLSFLTEELKAECRLDPFAVLPREVALKCMAYLDAMSLGRAAQVSKSWKALADDDLLWRTMCEQHIARKCEKCGWGLPLLEKRRKQISSSSSAAAAAGPSSSTATSSAMALTTSTAQAQFRYENSQHNHTPLPKNLEEALGRASSPSRAKRPRLNGNTGFSSNLHLDDLTILSAPPSPKQAPAGSFQAQQQQAQQSQSSSSTQLTRPWKSVYCERLAIARNWARGKCTFKVLQGHTDAITCLQLDDSLHDVPYPVLMTGSWDRTIRIWNAETGACVSVLRGHTRGVRCIQFDSAKLITGGMDSTLRIWSWRTGQCIRTLEGHRDSVISLCFDKHVLASGSADSTIKVWDFNTAECFTLRGHREWVNQVKIWSPESSDCSVSATPTAMSSMAASAEAGPSSSSSAPSLSPMAGKLLFSASDDGTVKVWDLMVSCLSFSPRFAADRLNSTRHDNVYAHSKAMLPKYSASRSCLSLSQQPRPLLRPVTRPRTPSSIRQRARIATDLK